MSFKKSVNSSKLKVKWSRGQMSKFHKIAKPNCLTKLWDQNYAFYKIEKPILHLSLNDK
jgi:hypothetical protein